MAATAIGVVLAGGRGARLGEPKPTARLAGRALIEHPLGAVREAGLDAVVVAKQASELPELPVPVWREPDEPLHPLAGIVHALGRAERPIVAVGCDLPFVAPALAAWLADRPEPLVVPEVGGRLHPLLARYAPSLLDRLADALERRAPLQESVRALGPVVIGEGELERFGDPARITFNVNTPEDLKRAARLSGPAD